MQIQTRRHRDRRSHYYWTVYTTSIQLAISKFNTKWSSWQSLLFVLSLSPVPPWPLCFLRCRHGWVGYATYLIFLLCCLRERKGRRREGKQSGLLLSCPAKCTPKVWSVSIYEEPSCNPSLLSQWEHLNLSHSRLSRSPSGSFSFLPLIICHPPKKNSNLYQSFRTVGPCVMLEIVTPPSTDVTMRQQPVVLTLKRRVATKIMCHRLMGYFSVTFLERQVFNVSPWNKPFIWSIWWNKRNSICQSCG